MTGLLALVWLAGSIASLVFIFRPKADWPPYANRKRAAGMFFAFFLGVPLLISAVGGGAAKPDAPAVQAPPTPEEAAAAAAKAVEERRAEMRRKPQDFLELEKTSASKSGFDVIFMLEGAIKNTGEVDYKDPILECSVFSKTDTPLGKVRQTLYEAVPAGKIVSFRELNMGFVQSEWGLYSCDVVGGALVTP